MEEELTRAKKQEKKRSADRERVKETVQTDVSFFSPQLGHCMLNFWVNFFNLCNLEQEAPLACCKGRYWQELLPCASSEFRRPKSLNPVII